MNNLLSIGQATEQLGVDVSTLRRWDKSGRLKAIRSQGGHRYYRQDDLTSFLLTFDLAKIALSWVTTTKPYNPPSIFYCQTSSVFQARLQRLEGELLKISKYKDSFSLITSSVGEIGNNSFDHNLGQWPDIPGIFFAYNIGRKQIVLADRGQGILNTLKRVRPNLISDQEALTVAFTEYISGRAPENRGNGLKWVKENIINNDFKLLFLSGVAKLNLKKGDVKLNLSINKKAAKGCLAVIYF
jgi:excisionase family DNA binding protein